jgi:hypothetical protein
MMIPSFPAPPRNDRRPNKSAFPPEGKMNKVGPCTAAAIPVAEKAQFLRAFATSRSSTVFRFGAGTRPSIRLHGVLWPPASQRLASSLGARAAFCQPKKLKTTGRALPVVLEV